MSDKPRPRRWPALPPPTQEDLLRMLAVLEEEIAEVRTMARALAEKEDRRDG